jgi:adenosylmethionine-8-amino-7-oxononanoate aminotransferase
MGMVSADGELVIVRGEGSHVWDERGRRYLDAVASLWYANVGYGRVEIADAVADQIRELHAYQTFGDLATPPALALAERLAGLAPVPDSKVFLVSGGSDSVDSAVKLIRRHWQLMGEPQREVFLVRERAYHGMHSIGTSLGGIAANLVGHDRSNMPIVGAGGVLLPPDGYLVEVQRLCREAGALFVADEVVTAFGRTGDWFASGRFGLSPDLITFAKGVTSGYLPLGGLLVAPHVAEPFWDPEAGRVWRHGYTYSGHAAGCVAAMANLDIIEREGLLNRGLALESELAAALAPLADHPLVSEVRSGLGAMAAVQLDPERLSADPSLAGAAVPAARERGLLTRLLTGDALQISPPLIVTDDEIEEMVAGLQATLDTLVDR